eukprot:9489141-Pyramimonas_sp.AAC.1
MKAHGCCTPDIANLVFSFGCLDFWDEKCACHARCMCFCCWILGIMGVGSLWRAPELDVRWRE